MELTGDFKNSSEKVWECLFEMVKLWTRHNPSLDSTCSLSIPQIKVVLQKRLNKPLMGNASGRNNCGQLACTSVNWRVSMAFSLVSSTTHLLATIHEYDACHGQLTTGASALGIFQEKYISWDVLNIEWRVKTWTCCMKRLTILNKQTPPSHTKDFLSPWVALSGPVPGKNLSEVWQNIGSCLFWRGLGTSAPPGKQNKAHTQTHTKLLRLLLLLS